MLSLNKILKYPVLTILSRGKRSFENMGLLIRKSGDTVRRLLFPAETSHQQSRSICQSMFAKSKTLCIGIDDTLIRKPYSRFIQGAGMFFDTKIGRCIMALRLTVGMITDGKFSIPIDCAYTFTKEILDLIKENFPTKDDIAKSFIKTAINLFPGKKLIAVVDGLYASIKFVAWCKAQNIMLEFRMHSNRVVEYKGKRIKVRDFSRKKGLRPKGRQMARTISVTWHKIELELTIVRRFDKNGKESIIFQGATYKALPREHVANYRRRWKVEALNRTTKQELGLQECFSRRLPTQRDHAAAVLLSYSLAQLERKIARLKTVEQAIRRFKTQNAEPLINRFVSLAEHLQYPYA